MSIWERLSAVLAAASLFAAPPASAETDWRISHSLGLDALVFVGALSGDDLASQHYQQEVRDTRARLSENARTALDALDQTIRVEGKGLTGPNLALYFSAGPTARLDDLLAAIESPEKLRTALAETAYWDEAGWARFVSILPHLRIVLDELRRVGFEKEWAREVLPRIEQRREAFRLATEPYDVISEQERLLGRELDPTIEIILVHYSQPYGIRISGQRFLTHHSYSPEIQLRTAAHEIFHPPFDLDDAELWAALGPLERDRWMRNIVDDHDPRFGYNSFEGIVNEDSTQALDQIVSERLGFARNPAKRFREADGGMHLLAAALYHAMKESGFAERGGTYADWLVDAARRGLLSPSEVRRRARDVVGAEAVDRWDY